MPIPLLYISYLEKCTNHNFYLIGIFTDKLLFHQFRLSFEYFSIAMIFSFVKHDESQKINS